MMPPTSFVYGIPRFAVTRPVTVLMLLLTMLVLGFITATRIPLSLFPEGYQNNRLFINANYPNASPRDVEEKVTRKIEDVIGTVSGVSRIVSFSGSGYSSVRV